MSRRPAAPLGPPPPPDADTILDLRLLIESARETISLLRREERTRQHPRPVLIARVAAQVAQVEAYCDGGLGYTDPEDAAAATCLPDLRWDWADLTFPGGPYPVAGCAGRLVVAPGRAWDGWADRGAQESPAPALSQATGGFPVAWDDTPRFLRALFGQYGKGFVSIRRLTVGRDVRGLTPKKEWFRLPDCLDDPTDLVATARAWDQAGYDVFVGVAPRGRHGADKKPDIYQAGVKWVEIDFYKRGESPEETLARLLAAEPTVVVRSGGGLHGYWVLPQVYDLGERERAAFERSLAKFQAEWGCDKVHDITRILRLPGTRNHKPDYPAPQRVELLRCP